MMGLLASYNISLMIANSGKAHTIVEELIIPAISEVIRTVLHKLAFDITKKISLSNSTVQRRIDEMAQDVEDSLCDYLKTSPFSIQLDELTLLGNEALLLAYVKFVKEEQICHELLFAKYLETDTKGESVFHASDEFFKEKGIPLGNILSAATDGAPAMILGAICQNLLISYGLTYSLSLGSSYYSFLTTVSASVLTSLVLLICYTVSQRTFQLVRQSLFEILFNGITSFLYLTSSCYLAFAVNTFLYPVYKITSIFQVYPAMSANYIVGFILGSIHGYDSWLAYKKFH